MRLAAFILVALLTTTAQAQAADLSVLVKTAAGEPVRDAVVTVYPNGAAPGGAIKFDWAYRVAQHNIQFEPFVLIVPVGATVSFPNLDTVRHHVYSFSPAKKFEIKLYGRDETRTATFDKPGLVALGCNIHDPMMAFIKVVDTRYAAKTDAQGRLTVRDLPAGAVTVKLWHPFLKVRGGEMSKALTAPAQGAFSETFVVEVRPPQTAHGGGH